MKYFVLKSEKPKNNFDEVDYRNGLYRNWVGIEKDYCIYHTEIFDRFHDSFEEHSRRINLPKDFSIYLEVDKNQCSNFRRLF